MSATITLPIEIDTEIEGLLAGKAALAGVTVGEFAARTLRHVARRPTISEVFADVRAEFEADGMTEEELQKEIELALAEVRAERRA